MTYNLAVLDDLAEKWDRESVVFASLGGDISSAESAVFSALAKDLRAAIALMRGQSEGVIRLPELPEQDVEGVRFDGFSISAMEDFARRAVAMNERSCVWTIDADPYAEMWNGACGIAWTFTEGDPADNECNHCPKCGGRIEVTEAAKQERDDA